MLNIDVKSDLDVCCKATARRSNPPNFEEMSPLCVKKGGVFAKVTTARGAPLKHTTPEFSPGWTKLRKSPVETASLQKASAPLTDHQPAKLNV